MDANDLRQRSVVGTAHRYENCCLCSRLKSGLVQPGGRPDGVAGGNTIETRLMLVQIVEGLASKLTDRSDF